MQHLKARLLSQPPQPPVGTAATTTVLLLETIILAKLIFTKTMICAMLADAIKSSNYLFTSTFFQLKGKAEVK